MKVGGARNQEEKTGRGDASKKGEVWNEDGVKQRLCRDERIDERLERIGGDSEITGAVESG